MKSKILILMLLITSLVGYLEWGGGNHNFLFQIEFELLCKIPADPASISHPFIILPLLGQLFLLINFFLNRPNRILSYLGIGCIGMLLIVIFISGVISMNVKMLVSTLPFLITAVYTIRHYRLIQVKEN